MNKILRFVPLLAAGALASGCNDFDYGVTADAFKQKEYAENFEKVFGTPDPNQDWSMAAVINADIDLPSVNGTCKVSVYTSRPGNADCKLVTSKTISSSSTISFDYPKNLSKVFVEVVNGNAVVISDYFTIENNAVVASTSKGGTRAGDCAVGRTFVDAVIGSIGTLPTWVQNEDKYAGLRDLINIDGDHPYNIYNVPYNNTTTGSESKPGIFDLYQLTNYSYTVGDGNSWTVEDLLPILGYDGVFEEQCTASLAKGEGCAREEWLAELKPEVGIDFQMAADGPVTLELMYGATMSHNKFGYLFYPDGATFAQIMSAPRYIVMEDAKPETNLLYTGGFNSWNLISNNIDDITNPTKGYVTEDTKTQYKARVVTGTKIPLVYFDNDGNSSYTFPEGTHIVFFEIMGKGLTEDPTQWGGDLRYSRPDMNSVFGYTYSDTHSPKPTSAASDGDRRFITYSWGETIIMGMEDTSDDDMNDLLFSVKGNFTEKPKDINPETPKNLKWLVACEDLGGTFDYDFNDIVIGFEKKDVDGTDHLFLQPLAAGGTLPSVISYQGYTGSELKEIHEMLGGVKLNDAYAQIYADFDADQIDLGVCPDDIATALKKLSINVNAQNNSLIVLESDFQPAGGSTPQMLLLPGGWDWPTEGTRITNVYNDFVAWAQDATYTSWTKKSTVKSEDYINNTWGK